MRNLTLLLTLITVSLAAITPAEADLPLPKVLRTSIMWVGGEHMTDVERVKSLNINFLNAWPRVPDTSAFVPAIGYTDAVLETWKKELDELHAAGVLVCATTSSASYDPAMFKRFGLDPEAYHTRDESGESQKSLGGAFGKDLVAACYNNPHWIGLQRDVAVRLADAGFDGMWYDLGGYADDNVKFCQCDYCKASWKEELAASGLPADTPLPTRANGKDNKQLINQQHLLWRLRLWEMNWGEVVKAAKEKHPHFSFSHNLGAMATQVDTFATWLHYATNLFDYIHWEEYGHSLAPYSQMPTYLLGVAAGEGKPVMMLTFDKPTRNDVQHRVALAEAIATSSGHQHGNYGANEINRSYNDLVAAHEELYAESESLATVGVVYGWWNNVIREAEAKRNPPHYFAQMLLDMHVPFDFVIAERDLTAERLGRYKTLVLPDIALLSAAQLEAIRAFQKGGGALFITGELGTQDEHGKPRTTSGLTELLGKAETGPGRYDSGGGRMVVVEGMPEVTYWEANNRDLQPEAKLVPPQGPGTAVKEDLLWAFGEVLPVRVEAPATVTVIARKNTASTLLHFVNYDVYPDAAKINPAKGIQVRLPWETGKAAPAITALTPGTDKAQEVAATVDGAMLSFTLPELEHYALVVVRSTAGEPSK